MTENHLPAAIQAAADGSLFTQPLLVETIRDAIALHFVRSHQTMLVHREAWETTRREARARWADNEAALNWAFFQRYGLYPARHGRLAREAILDEPIRPMDNLVESGAMIRIRIEHLLTTAKTMIASHGLEIARPASGEFLIGDTPALALRYDRQGIGPVGGVAIGDAHQIVLPLRPDLLASVGPADSFGIIPNTMVNAMNEAQVRAARRYVYFRPGGGLEQFVRDTQISFRLPRTAP